MVERKAGLNVGNGEVLNLHVGRLTAGVRAVLRVAAETAQVRGWQLYLVGGGVRDLLRSSGDDIGLTIATNPAPRRPPDKAASLSPAQSQPPPSAPLSPLPSTVPHPDSTLRHSPRSASPFAQPCSIVPH